MTALSSPRSLTASRPPRRFARAGPCCPPRSPRCLPYRTRSPARNIADWRRRRPGYAAIRQKALVTLVSTRGPLQPIRLIRYRDHGYARVSAVRARRAPGLAGILRGGSGGLGDPRRVSQRRDHAGVREHPQRPELGRIEVGHVSLSHDGTGYRARPAWMAVLAHLADDRGADDCPGRAVAARQSA